MESTHLLIAERVGTLPYLNALLVGTIQISKASFNGEELEAFPEAYPYHLMTILRAVNTSHQSLTAAQAAHLITKGLLGTEQTNHNITKTTLAAIQVEYATLKAAYDQLLAPQTSPSSTSIRLLSAQEEEIIQLHTEKAQLEQQVMTLEQQLNEALAKLALQSFAQLTPKVKDEKNSAN